MICEALDYGLTREELTDLSDLGLKGSIGRVRWIGYGNPDLKQSFYSYLGQLNNSSKIKFKCCAQLSDIFSFQNNLLNEKTICPSTFPSHIFQRFCPAKSLSD